MNERTVNLSNLSFALFTVPPHFFSFYLNPHPVLLTQTFSFILKVNIEQGTSHLPIVTHLGSINHVCLSSLLNETIQWCEIHAASICSECHRANTTGILF